MARIVFGMNVSLDGYVDHMKFAPDPVLFQHFIESTATQTGSLYGRTMYEIMRYWDDEQPEWEDAERKFATAWRKAPKWVASTTLDTVGPNAELVGDDLAGTVQRLKAEHDGEIEVAGTRLAQSLTDMGLIDEYRLYLHPVVLGTGTPYFAGVRPPLKLAGSERFGDVMRLCYVPA